ncbi:GNAT family N-acetyltransferase [Paenibacillus sp. GCM10023252]|uniref:GNAT family N-acetyltransferase n=1 Tax=Paenibacillus sp. GCM10023252 TaxID=3252649 RepID=UPI0036171D3A
MYEQVKPLESKHIKRAGETLLEAFIDSPMFVYLFPESASRRRILKFVFPKLIQLFHASGTVYVTSDEVEGIFAVRRYGVVRDKRRLAILALRTLPLLPYVFRYQSPLSIHRRALQTKDASSALAHYREHYHNFIIIDAVAVHPDHQGQKHLSKLMRSALEEARRTHTFIVLQTETETNVSIYRHLGFELVRSYPCAGGAFHTYVMLYDPHHLTAPRD